MGAAAAASFANLDVAQNDTALLVGGLAHSAWWQVRLARADPDFGVRPLSDALRDPHLDVREAAVLSLATWPHTGAAHDALQLANDDSDADVRAYARRALDSVHPLSWPHTARLVSTTRIGCSESAMVRLSTRNR